MDPDLRLSALLEAAEALGIEVRFEELGGTGGGLCVLKGRRVLFVDQGSDAATRYDRAVRELAQLPEIDTIFIRPDVREDLDRARGEA
jgi:hypothetical protein